MTVLSSTVGNCGIRHTFCRVIWPQVRWQPLTRQITTRSVATASIQNPNSFYLVPQMLTGPSHWPLPLASPLTASTRDHHNAATVGSVLLHELLSSLLPGSLGSYCFVSATDPFYHPLHLILGLCLNISFSERQSLTVLTVNPSSSSLFYSWHLALSEIVLFSYLSKGNLQFYRANYMREGILMYCLLAPRGTLL